MSWTPFARGGVFLSKTFMRNPSGVKPTGTFQEIVGSVAEGPFESDTLTGNGTGVSAPVSDGPVTCKVSEPLKKLIVQGC